MHTSSLLIPPFAELGRKKGSKKLGFDSFETGRPSCSIDFITSLMGGNVAISEFCRVLPPRFHFLKGVVSLKIRSPLLLVVSDENEHRHGQRRGSSSSLKGWFDNCVVQRSYNINPFVPFALLHSLCRSIKHFVTSLVIKSAFCF